MITGNFVISHDIELVLSRGFAEGYRVTALKAEPPLARYPDHAGS
jgi:hypothetical protein